MAATCANVTRRDHAKDEIVLGVLDVVDKDAEVTQRSVASELGIAVGLANAYLKRCIRKGLIRVSQIPPRRYSYFLTPQGFAEKSRLTANYLSNSFAFFRHARSQCAELFEIASSRGQRHIALIGEGDLAEIAGLVAREFPLEIVGVIRGEADHETLKAQANALGKIDAVIVTALVDPSEVYATALDVFGANRVHVPALLRVRQTGQEAT